jgi:hypothetical protein
MSEFFLVDGGVPWLCPMAAGPKHEWIDAQTNALRQKNIQIG